MASLNKVFLAGNLTRDPDLRQTRNGMAVCEFGIAVNRRMREKDEVLYIDVTAWSRAAENCAQFLKKGAAVLIEGRLSFEQWEDRNGGGKRTKIGVVADVVQFLNGRSDFGEMDRQFERNDRGYSEPPKAPRYSPHDIPGYDQDEDIPF